MSEKELSQVVERIRAQAPGSPFAETARLLSQAKLQLLKLNALTPPSHPSSSSSSSSSSSRKSVPSAASLSLAREVYELGAVASIRAHDTDSFTRYVEQLKPFYELASSSTTSSSPSPSPSGEKNKIIGLYLLLLLTQGRYSEFHSELESLANRHQHHHHQHDKYASKTASNRIEQDAYLGYPIRLERWLMEGSYDQVWHAVKSREVPCEEYRDFSEILISQIRLEIASCSERAYQSLPISSTKSLLFLDSEGAVLDFARYKGWSVVDGHLYFSADAAAAATAALSSGGGVPKSASSDLMDVDGHAAPLSQTNTGVVSTPACSEKGWNREAIAKTLGYARELESIV